MKVKVNIGCTDAMCPIYDQTKGDIGIQETLSILGIYVTMCYKGGLHKKPVLHKYKSMYYKMPL